MCEQTSHTWLKWSVYFGGDIVLVYILKNWHRVRRGWKRDKELDKQNHLGNIYFL